MPPAKKDLLRGLENIGNSYLFGMVASKLSHPEEWTKITAFPEARFQGLNGSTLSVPLQQLVSYLAQPSSRKIVVEEFENTLKRAILTDTFETILWYSKATGQDCSSDPLFQFARVIRNIASHKTKGILEVWPQWLYDRGIMEVRWRDRTFTKEHDVGKELLLVHHEILQLYMDMRAYAIEHLK